jgi:hypothetical protein
MSGVAVLDIDIKHDAACAWWVRHEHLMPETRSFQTRSGGTHLFFKFAPGIRCASARPVPGVDIRGDGGYVIFWFAAGHECTSHSPPAPFPAWLRRAIWPPRQPASTQGRGASPGAIEGILKRVQGAAQGERNTLLHWGACRMLERVGAGDITRADAERDLVAAALASGLTQAEAQRTISSAWRSA